MKEVFVAVLIFVFPDGHEEAYSTGREFDTANACIEFMSDYDVAKHIDSTIPEDTEIITACAPTIKFPDDQLSRV